jgi:sigma-B regulation protein RsbU (phosphoserine phosphatase)
LATLFAAATILYSALWTYFTFWRPTVQLGFDNDHLQAEQCELITNVYKDSPAEKAGLRAGDRILKVDGQRFESAYSLTDMWAKHRPGDAVELTVKRPDVAAPLVIRGVFRAYRSPTGEAGLTEHMSRDITSTFPIAFLVVGLAVLFLRLEDPNAWLLALMFAGTIAAPGFPSGFQALGPSLRRFAMADRAIFNGFDPALVYFFFGVFPARSPLDRRAPWLKWLGLALGLSMTLPGLAVGAYQVPSGVARLLGQRGARLVQWSYAYGFVTLGLLSLVGNSIVAPTPEARRKMRVILWGTLVGVVPILLAFGAQDFFGSHISLGLGAVLVLLLYLFPLSFAYAVVKHRVLEIPVLLRRSARYLLVQRGFLFLHILVSVGAAVAFAWGLSRTRMMTPAGLTGGVIFGSALAFGGIRIHKATSQRIDRAFFRHAYDARRILEDLVEKTRTATNRNELAALLEHHLNQALQPSFLAVYLETGDNELSAARGSVPPELGTIPASHPMLTELARHGRPWDVSSSGDAPQPFLLAPLQPDCLVPILGRDGRLVGLVILGQRLSEEPYSREDKQLLASVASQAGVGLESIRLGEKIAERLEAERRAAQELEFAREVQARLFPQKLPRLQTLDYTGGCVPARQVGGDYYDFLELRPGRMALVLADIAGKGISGALLMANLQANLRSQYAMALDDLPRLLKSVNQLFYENTSESSYATLFFGDYDDSSRRLRYVNCGHLPPLLLRSGQGSPHRGVIPPKLVLREGGGAGIHSVEGAVIPAQAGIHSVGGAVIPAQAGIHSVEGAVIPAQAGIHSPDKGRLPPAVVRLQPTCTVLGLFERWECSVAEVQLAPGDTLVLYTDGVTEAASEVGEEFGEERLIEILRAQRHLPVPTLLETILAKVEEFSDRKQADDITLVIARCKPLECGSEAAALTTSLLLR